jgi:succinate dehydrogenase / fumarate reductase, cytochrome b subunit
MPVTGLVLLLFIAFHILDLTTGTSPVAGAGYRSATGSESFAYQNLVASFDRPLVSAFYLLAMVVLGLHLAHGLWSAVNDLGVTGHRLRQVAVAAAGIVAGVVFVGNASIPIAVLTGLVR